MKAVVNRNAAFRSALVLLLEKLSCTRHDPVATRQFSFRVTSYCGEEYVEQFSMLFTAGTVNLADVLCDLVHQPLHQAYETVSFGLLHKTSSWKRDDQHKASVA
jgi:hypothetical protein